MSNQTAKTNMIKQQLRTGNVLDETILHLYESLPREQFVPPNQQAFAYSDMQLELAHNQRMMTPLEEGLILQALKLTGREKVLEIGTGSGYLTALLSRLSKQVISLEYFSDLSANAALKLTDHRCHNVTCLNANGAKGLIEQAPYDAIVVSATLVDLIPETLLLQVTPGGRLITFEGAAPVRCQLRTLQANKQWQIQLLFETNLPAMLGCEAPSEFIF